MSITQLVLHAVAPQEYGAHGFVLGVQWPPPSHVERTVSMPLVHAGVPQVAVVEAKWQAAVSVPLHDVPQPASGEKESAAHPCRVEPVGSRGAPTTGTQVPTLPGSAHA